MLHVRSRAGALFPSWLHRGPSWWYEPRGELSWPAARADNLKLFHELAGPVYPPRKISTLRIPPGYPQQPLLDSQLAPEAWGDEVL